MNGKPYILCADDVLRHQINISEMLHDDFELACTASGMACVESIVQRVPDLLLLGDKMPLTSTYDTCRFLRENTEYQDIPIISFSENDSDVVEPENSSYRCNLYLKPPLDKERLIDSIQALLK